ncbi:hypothetical protein PHLGIDRAFT_130845 [Phlebiopsis gigantea 11061_1 CR5-6]|uniref:F-box domain-containing protein n=1 Tax=Phlebiopsis gigantea (strain 11061_1 CR5-6) TaxID=745531 RepID=A0A0C3S373_PHLG1|nr:hypothetical protein PHLGIDRAFT_130845 [Phlebiopsis gigantea 11061_1 CR5-6]
MGDVCFTSSSDTPRRILPVELCYLVIDFVAIAQSEREATLAACALVCHAWLSVARPHIFHSVALRSFREYDRFFESLRSGSRIADHVRVLHFKIRSMSLGTGDHNRTLPVSLFAQLPALESISYYSSLTAQTLQLRAELSRLPRVPSVTNFSIHICVFRKFSDMVLLLSAFPNLKKLRLFEVIFVEHDTPHFKNMPVSSLPLRSLHLESLKEARPVFAWLVSTNSMYCLRNVSVGVDVEGSLAILSQFLQICGDSIKHLSIRTRAGVPIRSRHGDLNLADAPHLHSISFHIRYMTELHTLPQLLATATSSLLSKITVRLDPPSIADATVKVVQAFDRQLDECTVFDRLLSSDRFPRLQSIIFDVPPSLQPQLIRSLNQSMPLLTARKVLYL